MGKHEEIKKISHRFTNMMEELKKILAREKKTHHLYKGHSQKQQK